LLFFSSLGRRNRWKVHSLIFITGFCLLVCTRRTTPITLSPTSSRSWLFYCPNYHNFIEFVSSASINTKSRHQTAKRGYYR
jgi:hypothetical protein